MSQTARVRNSKRAPTYHYVLAVAFGAIVTIAVSLAVGASNPEHFWPTVGICALCAIYPAMSLGVRVLVTDHTVSRDRHGEESAELSWMRQAAGGTFLDVLITTIVVAVVLMLVGAVVEALPVMLALIGLSAVDVALRYVLIRHRALR